MAAQRIGAGEQSTPLEIVRWMLAIQAQDFPGAKWSVGLRQVGLTESVVEAACDAGEIVRSWPLRGTLHLVAGEDLGWLLALTARKAVKSAAPRRAMLGITEVEVERARWIALEALAGRRVMKRDVLLSTIDAAGVSTAGQRGYHVLWYLAQTGTLVLGPTDGRQQTFALLDDWVARPRQLDREEALGELALRYFRSHGPARAADLARWSGLTMGEARRGIAICGIQLATLELEGVTYHLDPENDGLAAGASRVELLPGFDEYVLGYGDRSAAIAPEHSNKIVPGGNGIFKPTIVVDGEIVGTWSRTVRTREVVLEVVTFSRLGVGVLDELAAAARAYGDFIGRPVRLSAQV